MNAILNFALYQLAWCLCVFLGNTGGLLAVSLLAVHIYLSPVRMADLRLMGLLLLAGLILDGGLGLIGVLKFNDPAKPIPFWLAVIWLSLAILPHHSLKWMKNRPVLSAIFGALGGPMAYWAGVRLGAAKFGIGLSTSLFILAVAWAILWPVVMWYAKQDLVPETNKEQ